MIAELFITHSVEKLEQMTGYIENCLDRLHSDQIWARSVGPGNAVGNLVLHLSGNLGQWIGHYLAGRADTRDRPAEFEEETRFSAAELKAMLRAAVDSAKSDIAALTAEQLAAAVVTADSQTHVLTLVYQVVGHFQQHAGQVIFATKLITRHDLGFYVTPSEASEP